MINAMVKENMISWKNMSIFKITLARGQVIIEYISE